MDRHAQLQPRVLIVDDNDDVRLTLEEILSVEGYACTCAPTADAALESLRASAAAPSVILLDMVMPGMSAPDFVAQMKTFPPWSAIPILLISASTSVPDTLKVNGVVSKPFNIQALLGRIHDLVAE